MQLTRDSLEVMSLSLAISLVLASLETSRDLKHFVIDSLLLIRKRSVYIVHNFEHECQCELHMASNMYIAVE